MLWLLLALAATLVVLPLPVPPALSPSPLAFLNRFNSEYFDPSFRGVVRTLPPPSLAPVPAELGLRDDADENGDRHTWLWLEPSSWVCGNDGRRSHRTPSGVPGTS